MGPGRSMVSSVPAGATVTVDGAYRGVTPLRVPLVFNLRRDPFERGPITSNTYYDWLIDRAYLLVPAQTYVGRFLETFQEFPPRMKPASFGIDQILAKMEQALNID